MATAFSENEKELIRQKIKTVAQECLSKYGVRKTTIDQLVQMTGISKGAFYAFYPSKEILFFTLIEEYQKSIIEEFCNNLTNNNRIGPKEFSELIYELYKKVRHSFIMNIIQNQEFEYLIRKIPEEYILEHHSLDDMLAKHILSNLRVKENTEVSVLSAYLRAIFMSMLHVREIGEQDFDKVLKLLITGFAQQFIEENCYDK